ncbi:MAG: lysophospholipid acyltransferase family protein [Candidatus Omnitrophica bacterium]|nr:lysophospholipid acyltransferase family protein [Candidatus Omnitrophota bacterium]
MRVLISIFFWIMAGIFTLGVFLGALFCATVLYPFDRKRKMAHTFGFLWSDCLAVINPFWSLKIEGLENIDRNKVYVLVANHQSMADIVVVYKTRVQFKWVAKDALYRIPIFGWTMMLMKYMRLARGEFGSIKDVYDQAALWLRDGVSVLFFPEGTRANSEEMGPFKNGAFKLAVKEQVPVLPFYIGGAREIFKKGSWVFKGRADCTLRILPPVDTISYGVKDFARLRDDVRNRLLAEQEKEK